MPTHCYCDNSRLDLTVSKKFETFYVLNDFEYFLLLTQLFSICVNFMWLCSISTSKCM